MTILQRAGSKLSNTQWTEMFCAGQENMQFEALQVVDQGQCNTLSDPAPLVT